MATASTVPLNPPHAPKSESIKAFDSILPELRQSLAHLRRDHDKHEPAYFAAVSKLSDAQLTGFSSEQFDQVRVGSSAYGLHLFGRVRIPALDEDGPCYVHFRAFVGGTEEGEEAKLHSIHTEEKEEGEGEGKHKTFRAIFTRNDSLNWFDS